MRLHHALQEVVELRDKNKICQNDTSVAHEQHNLQEDQAPLLLVVLAADYDSAQANPHQDEVDNVYDHLDLHGDFDLNKPVLVLDGVVEQVPVTVLVPIDHAAVVNGDLEVLAGNFPHQRNIGGVALRIVDRILVLIVGVEEAGLADRVQGHEPTVHLAANVLKQRKGVEVSGVVVIEFVVFEANALPLAYSKIDNRV